MNVVIFSGGTGSINLQKSFNLYYKDNINLDIIINCYDNGKSTGLCRQVASNNILGPSDLRKNQITQFECQFKDRIYNNENYKNVLLYFEDRFCASTWNEAENRCKNIVDHLANQGISSFSINKDLLMTYVREFFKMPFSHNIEYTDFSASNIFYTGCAICEGCSLAKAGHKMAKILGIKDNVHMISDVNLYLTAVTKSGNVISDEGIIVAWNNTEDPIIDIKLSKLNGKEYIPTVDEDLNTAENEKLIKDADVIIFSSGTQWSSLIPTYVHKGFAEMIKKSKAAKYLVMNNSDDKDMTNVGSTELLKIVNRFVDLSDFTVVYNENAKDIMKYDSSADSIIGRHIIENLSDINQKKHNDTIAYCIIRDYYRKFYDGKKYLFFDFDDTLFSRNVESRKVSVENINVLYKRLYEIAGCMPYIFSGNSIKHFIDVFSTYSVNSAHCIDHTDVFCNGGGTYIDLIEHNEDTMAKIKNNYSLEYRYDMQEFYDIEYILLNNPIISSEISYNMIDNRDRYIISIKPIYNKDIRNRIIVDIKKTLAANNIDSFDVEVSGSTTINIFKKGYKKSIPLQEFLTSKSINANDVLYIGDEIEKGNDSDISSIDGITILPVKDVYDTNAFLTTFLSDEKLTRKVKIGHTTV